MRNAYDKYEFHTVYHRIHHFCSVDLGGFYLDVLKDRLYCDAKDGHKRRSAQTAMYIILQELVQLLAPITVFTADEIWQHIPGNKAAESVHLTRWQQLPVEYKNPALNQKWEKMLEVRRVVAKALEEARSNKLIGSSNDASITVYGNPEIVAELESFKGQLEMLFIVSDVELLDLSQAEGQDLVGDLQLGVKVRVDKADGEKCERCWRYSESVGQVSEEEAVCERCHTVLQGS